MIQNFLIADGSVFLIPILVFLPLIVFIIVVIVLCIKGLHQNISDAVNGHTVQIVTGFPGRGLRPGRRRPETGRSGGCRNGGRVCS